MNEIKKCSIGGISFTLEQSAYEELSTYIDTLHEAYKDDPDGEEILADIEARIAELILSTQSAEGVVARPLIDNIIKQLGTPHEIDDEKADSAPRSAEHTDKNGNPRIPRRLYRDLENSKLGGVCAGLAKYFDIDPTWVRLAMFAPLILSVLCQMNIFQWMFIYKLSSMMSSMFGFMIIAYIIMWFSIPAASTARQKLEQQGERVTAQGIKNNTQVAPDERERTLVAKIVMAVGSITLIVLKIFAALMLVGLIVGGSVLGLVALSSIPMIAFDMATGLALMAFFFVVLVPIVTLIYLAIALIGSRKPSSKFMLIMLVLWIISLVTMTVSAIKSPVRFGNSIENAFESVFEHDEDILYDEFSEEEVEEFRRKVGATTADTEGDITRTHIQGDTQIVLRGDAAEVKALETNITFGENGVEIVDGGKSVLSITKDGITVDNEKVATFKEDENGFTMSIGDVKIKVNDEGGSVTAAANGVKEGHDYRVVDDIAVERHQKSDRVIIFCGEADDVRECKERLNFTNTEITFVADNKYCVRINRSGEVDNGYAKLRNRVSDKIDADTRYGEFFVDNADVLVYYEIGPNADMYRKSAESLCRLFKKLD